MRPINEMTPEEIEIAETLTRRPELMKFMKLCMTMTSDEQEQVLKMCKERAQK